jgi:protein-disulfide isomerase
MRKFTHALFVILLTAAVFAGLPARADDASLSDAQKRQVEEIIRGYLLENPELLIEVMERLEQKRKSAAQEQSKRQILANKDSIFRSPHDFAVNETGSIPVVEFFDYQCSYCKRILPTVQRLLKEQKNVRFVFKELPILGEASEVASKASLAAKKQGKYMEFHNAVMGVQRALSEPLIMSIAGDIGLDMDRLRTDMASPEIEKIIAENRKLADSLGIRGTPTLIIGETLVPGAIGYNRIMELVEEARTSCRVC